MGSEYKARAEAGTYEIRVSSCDNDSKYAPGIGEILVTIVDLAWGATLGALVSVITYFIAGKIGL